MIDRSFYIGKDLLMNTMDFSNFKILNVGLMRCIGVLPDGSKFRVAGSLTSGYQGKHLDLGTSEVPRSEIMMNYNDILSTLRRNESTFNAELRSLPYYLVSIGTAHITVHKCSEIEDFYTGKKYWKTYATKELTVMQDSYSLSDHYYVADSTEDVASFIFNKYSKYMVENELKVSRPVNSSLQPVADFMQNGKFADLYNDREGYKTALMGDNTAIQGEHYKVDCIEVHKGFDSSTRVKKLESFTVSSEKAARVCVDYILDKYENDWEFDSNEIAETFTSISESVDEEIMRIATFEKIRL